MCIRLAAVVGVFNPLEYRAAAFGPVNFLPAAFNSSSGSSYTSNQSAKLRLCRLADVMFKSILIESRLFWNTLTYFAKIHQIYISDMGQRYIKSIFQIWVKVFQKSLDSINILLSTLQHVNMLLNCYMCDLNAHMYFTLYNILEK